MTFLVDDQDTSETAPNQAPEAYDTAVHRTFEEQARTRPSSVAVVFGDETITYHDLNRRSNQFAHYIRREYESAYGRELPTETLIAIYQDRGLDMVVAALGILKAGGAYIPIDRNLPADRIRYVISDAKCPIVVTQQHLTDQIVTAIETPNPGDKFSSDSIVTTIEIDRSPYRDEIDVNLSVPTTGRDLAYVIYTSGTTGIPKGVMIEHRSLANLAWSRQDAFGINEESTVLQLSPIAFDASVCEMFSALTHGARLVIATDEARRDPAILRKLMRAESVTVATILPSLVTQLSYPEIPDLPDLATLVVAGEPCTDDLMRKWSSGRRLINAYGPTETTVCATVHEFQPGDTPSTIGVAIPNTQVHLLDENLKRVEAGAVGEICVTGIGLARGYLNLPDQTAERFIDNPYATRADHAGEANTMYRTGDLARHSFAGNLEYIGRNDSQVKIRGHRIELGEIENALLSFREIKQLCVVARARHSGTGKSNESDSTTPVNDQVLVVYYVADKEIDSTKIVQYLQRFLPEYMVPRFFVHMNSLPTTENGKIDRARLPAPTLERTSAPVPPRTRCERDILSVWQAVLGASSVGVEDDFFEIGGNSMLAVTLASEISSRVGRTLPVSTIYSHSSVASLADLMDRGASVDGHPISTFQTGGNRTPLFFVHPSMTGAELYRPMIEWLDPDQPFYGIESYNRDHIDDIEGDLSALAERYINLLRHIQPEGPYRIGGYSAGGNIAYEMAHQLVSIGETVDRVYLIDSVPLTEYVRENAVSSRDAQDFLDYFGLSQGLGDKRLLHLAQAEMNMLFNSKSRKSLDSKIVLFKAQNLIQSTQTLRDDHIAGYLFRDHQPCGGWAESARDINCIQIVANHTTIMHDENLKRVTRQIQEDINRI